LEYDKLKALAASFSLDLQKKIKKESLILKKDLEPLKK